MSVRRIYALGHDEYWLRAVAGIVDDTVEVQVLRLAEDEPLCLDDLPEPVPGALLLLDTTPEVKTVAQMLNQKGWRHVVIVAADPHWKEAKALIKQKIAYDYWPKSYEPDAIRTSVKTCLQEMREDAP